MPPLQSSTRDARELIDDPHSGLPLQRQRLQLLTAHYRGAIAAFGLALGLRLVFSALMANTFDKNEFVYLALGRAVAHGAVPYRDFGFFHPPGILAILGFLDPLARLWWPLVRLVDVLIDSITAVLVWRIGRQLYDERTAVTAGVLYAISPVVLLSAVRVNQEVWVTAFATAGLTILVTRSSYRAALLAGICLAVACWIRYPALVFLPLYLLVSPRRALPLFSGWLVTTSLLFLPYAGEWHQLYEGSVAWQLIHRYHTPLNVRLETILFFWLIANPLAVASLFRLQRPVWLLLAFLSGFVFVFTSSVYLGYFVPLAPFAALLGAPLAARIPSPPNSRFSLRSFPSGPLRSQIGREGAGDEGVPSSALLVPTIALITTLLWAVGIRFFAGEQGFVATSRFSAIRPIVRFIDRSTSPQTPTLSDRPELPYLAGRTPLVPYFWDDHSVVNAQDLERRLTPKDLVVLYPASNRSWYPAGFATYLDEHYERVEVSAAAVWLLSHSRS